MKHLQLYQLSAAKDKSMCAFDNTGHGCLNGDIMCESSLLVGFCIFALLGSISTNTMMACAEELIMMYTFQTFIT